MKRYLSALAAFVVMFLLSGLWYRGFMMEYMKNHAGIAGNIQRPESMIGMIALAYLALAAVMGYLYPKGIEGTNKVTQGLKFGAIIGFLWTTPTNLALYGATEIMTKNSVILDGLWHVFEGAIGGLVIALVYGMPKRSS